MDIRFKQATATAAIPNNISAAFAAEIKDSFPDIELPIHQMNARENSNMGRSGSVNQR